MIARVLVIAVALAAAPSTARAGVHTDPREVHACLPLDEGGRILAATRGGLVLVGANQRTAAVWTSLDGLPGTRADALLRDGDDVWVGTEGGLARVRIDGAALAIDATFASAPVRAIERHGDTLYMATWGDGVLRVDGDALVGVDLGGAGDHARVSDLVSHSGSLYAATAGHGVFELDGGVFRSIDLDLADTITWSLLGDGDDLLIGTVDGLYRYDGERGRRIGSGDIRDMERLDGEITAAVFGVGFRRVDDRLLRDADGLPGDETFPHTLAAIDGLQCIGSHHGLWTRRGTGSWKRAVVDGPPSNDITDIAVDGDRVWVATFDSGLAILQAGAWRDFDHELLDPNVNAIDFDGKRLFAATSAGLTIIAGDDVSRLTKREGLPSRHVLSVVALGDGSALVGTTRGAAIVRDGRANPIEGDRSMMRANVWAVGRDDDGWLWLGTTRGLYRGRVDSSGRVDGSWTRYSLSSGQLRDDWVTALAFSGTTVYAGTYKGGVTRVEVDEDATTFTQLGDGWVNPGGLTVHDGHLYASTMEGLRVGDGASAEWTSLVPTPGIDTTGVTATPQGLIVTSRRGMATFASDAALLASR